LTKPTKPTKPTKAETLENTTISGGLIKLRLLIAFKKLFYSDS
jgi:hypothetical protein